MLIPNFKGYVIENLDWSDRLEMLKLGISQEDWSVLKCDVDWSAVGEKRWDGTKQPFMRCSYWPKWPNDREPAEVWSEYPTKEITDLYLDGRPGDVELATEMMFDIARYMDADLLWVALDGDWYDVRTGEWIPEKLHKLI